MPPPLRSCNTTLLCIQLLCSPTQHAFEDAQLQLGATLLFIFFIALIYLVCMSHSAGVEVKDGNFRERLLSFYQVGPRDGT